MDDHAGATLRALAALQTRPGRALLAALPPYDEAAVLRLAERLRREYDTELVAAALTQSRLRSRAQRLGPLAEQLLLTADGVEQASRWSVATWRADRLAAAGATSVADLGAGLGVDAIAMTTAGLAVVAVERDPVTAAALRANTKGRPVRVLTADVSRALPGVLDGCDAVFADPARRRGGRRVLDPAGWSPPLPLISTAAASVPRAVAKMGPGLPHASVPAGAEAEWVSESGDVLECALWWGDLRTGVVRSATLLDRGVTVRADPGLGPPRVGRPGRFLHEPDGAVIRAGLVAETAAALGGGLLDASIAYVATDEPGSVPYATRYEVIDVMTFSVKRLRQLLRARDVGTLTVKKRGSAVTPEALRAQLRLTGDAAATVVLTRVDGAPTVLLVELRPDR